VKSFRPKNLSVGAKSFRLPGGLLEARARMRQWSREETGPNGHRNTTALGRLYFAGNSNGTSLGEGRAKAVE